MDHFANRPLSSLCPSVTLCRIVCFYISISAILIFLSLAFLLFIETKIQEKKEVEEGYRLVSVHQNLAAKHLIRLRLVGWLVGGPVGQSLIIS